jgi:hypothetical protein
MRSMRVRYGKMLLHARVLKDHCHNKPTLTETALQQPVAGPVKSIGEKGKKIASYRIFIRRFSDAR